jgi:hypothetical protein
MHVSYHFPTVILLQFHRLINNYTNTNSIDSLAVERRYNKDKIACTNLYKLGIVKMDWMERIVIVEIKERGARTHVIIPPSKYFSHPLISDIRISFRSKIFHTFFSTVDGVPTNETFAPLESPSFCHSSSNC